MTSPMLEALLALQAVDTDLDRHRHRRSSLPEKQAATQLQLRLVALDQRLASAREPFAEVVRRQEVLEADLAATEQRITSVNRRLYSGEVSAPRDLQAMSAEIEALKARQSDLEDHVLEVLDEREPLERDITVLVDERSEVVAGLERLVVTVAGLEAEIDGEIAVLAGRRDELAGGVVTDLLASYERLRSRLGGVGAARLIGAQCQGCFLTLPAAEVDRLKYLPEDAFVTCEDCGRILVRS